MSDDQLFEPSAAAKARAKVNAAQYEEMYARSISDPDGFWAEQAKRIDWIKPPTKIKNTTFAYPDISIKWFEDGVLNISANCIDRHLRDARRPGGDHLGRRHTRHRRQAITYRELHERGLPLRQRAQGARASRRATASPSTCR